jgi:glycerate kinase
MSDVVNPLCGEAGAAKIYAPQKGAGEAAISLLEEGAINFAVKARLLRAVDEQAKGAGAAGGLGFGAAFFLNATNKSGIEMMMDLTDFDAQVVQADVIITGEGRLDHQTANGKLIAGIVRRSQNKPVIALCGALNSSPNEVLEMGLTAAFSIGRGPGTLAAALALTAENLEQTAFNLGRVLKI